MSATNRAAVIGKLHKIAKKHYQSIAPPSDRGVLEHLLYGCCLENSRHEAADEALARLQEGYFDWNEVRVTTTAELAELLQNLHHPTEAANRIKRALHGVFESFYRFDIDFLRKENLGKALTQLGKFKGISSFVVSYVAQSALGGHSIPLDRAMMSLMITIGAVSETEAAKGKVPGLERTIPKSKGVEFSSLAHQLAVDYLSAPFNKNIRELILKIAPDAGERFPKRGGRKKQAKKPTEPEKRGTKAKKSPKSSAPRAGAKTKKKAAAGNKKVVKKKSGKKAAKKKTAAKKPQKKSAARKTSRKKSPTKRLARKKPR